MYILIFGVLFSFILIEYYRLVPKSNYSIFYFILFSLLVLHDGLRWEMATDFNSYLNHFNQLNSYNDFAESDFEYLYKLSVYFIKSIFNSYTVFLIFHAVVVYSIYFYSLKKYTSFPTISLLFLYVSMIGMLGSNRQNLALAFCFLGIYFVVNRKYLYFFLTILIAFGFHKTSIIFLPIVFLNRALNKKVLFGIACGVILLSFSSAFQQLFTVVTIQYLPSIFEDKANSYLLTNENFSNTFVSTLFGVGRKLLPIFILLYFKDKLKENKYYDIVFNITFISFLMYVAFNNNLQFLVGRLTIYYSIFECIVFSWLFMALKRAKINFLIIIIFFAYAILLFYRSIAIYPELFIPYKSIFQIN